MTLIDPIFGTVEITEPVLLDLIASTPIQRLKLIDQSGHMAPFLPGETFNRYEHSVGVMLLLRRYQCTLEEQIAGLIHDVSHTAFSHTVDYALAEGSEEKHDFQDSVFDHFVRESEIPTILKKYGYDLEYILNDDNFPLKENDLPGICADRIDYAPRTWIHYLAGDVRRVIKILDHLSVVDGQWTFDDLASADNFVNLFNQCNDIFISLEGAVMNKALGEYLKISLAEGFITRDDLFTTDGEVLAKIAPHHAHHTKLNFYFEAFNNRVRYVEDPDRFDFDVVTKSRGIDPFVLSEGVRVRYSDLVPGWKEKCTELCKPKHHYLRFL